MTDLTRPIVIRRPPALTHEIGDALRFTLNQLDPPYSPAPLVGREGLRRYVLRRDDVPKPEVQAAMRQRLQLLDTSLAAAGHTTAAEEYRMLTTMKASNASEDEVRRESVGFIEGTADLPAFALREACDAFRLGRISDGEWMPKVGQVRREAERLAAPYRRQQHELQVVLEAEVGPSLASTLENRSANVARVKAWIEEVKEEEKKARGRGMSEQEIERSRIIAAAIVADTEVPLPLPKLGRSIRATLNLPDLEEEPPANRFDEEVV